MIIHIKRFYFSERSMDYRKIDAPVEYASQIDLQTRQNQKGIYELYGVVHHFGTKSSGHYVADVRDLKSRKGAWYNCDDEMVKEISGPDTSSTTAYLLFYWRKAA